MRTVPDNLILARLRREADLGPLIDAVDEALPGVSGGRPRWTRSPPAPR